MSGDRFKLITVESDFGAGKKGAAHGPKALLKELKERNFEAIDIYNYLRLVPHEMPPSTDTPYGKNIENITNFQLKVCENISETLRLNKIPFILSGDHSSANALISGVKDVYANNRIGVIWIDAHADLHSPYTTPSGNIHGMPIAALMGHDHREMGNNQPKEITKTLWETLKKLGRRRISPKIQGKDIVFISLRSTEAEEERIIVKENIKVYNPDTIAQLGIEEVTNQTLQHLRNCEYIYVSFDVDSLDSSISTGTGTPVENGLTFDEGVYLLKRFSKLQNLMGLEITEINPSLDEARPMQKIIARLIETVFAK
ncbi:MAG: arginase [Bacteroidota bacterium]